MKAFDRGLPTFVVRYDASRWLIDVLCPCYQGCSVAGRLSYRRLRASAADHVSREQPMART